MLESFKDLYEVRKNASFRLEPQENAATNENLYNQDVDLSEILSKYKNFVYDLKNLLYIEGEKVTEEESDEEPSFTSKPFSRIFADLDLWVLQSNTENKEKDNDLSVDKLDSSNVVHINHKYLSKYFSKEFFENYDRIVKRNKHWAKTKNWTTIENNDFLEVFFRSFFNDAFENINKLQELIDTKENEQKRKADIAFEVRRLLSRNHLWKIFPLFKGGYLTHKNDIKTIPELTDQAKELKELLDNAKIYFLEDSNFWVQVEHISLNYYTRNKTQKEYDELIKGKKKLLDSPYNKDISELYWIDRNLPIKQLYEEMKMFKARQKSAFFQQLQNKTPFEKFKEPFTFIDNEWIKHKEFRTELFFDVEEKYYNEMLSLTKKIKKSGSKELKKERWNFLMFQDKWIKSFKWWSWFCSEYKKVAMEYWKRKAESLSLEREKILAEQERWWWVFSKVNNEFYINTFPIDKVKDAYQSLSKKQNDWELSYFILSSITLRALNKLCFSKDSKFINKEILIKLDNEFLKEKEYNNKTKEIVLRKKSDLTELELIKLYYNVLELQDSLWISYKNKDSLSKLKSSKNLEEFELNLKNETYKLEEFKTTEDEFNKILKSNEWKSYKIINKEKWNFEKWWKNFWNSSKDWEIRINPELNISLRKWNEDYNDKISFHRKKDDVYLLNVNFSHFANRSYIDSSFIEDDHRKENLKKFNNLYNENIILNYFYWLDKWTNELITLGLFKKEWGKINSVNISKEIPVYRITKKWLLHSKITLKKAPKEWQNPETIHTLYKNPSLFIDELDNEEIFEKVNIESCLWNLNSAKLIKWNIILNWDILTNLNLHKLSAKRQLYIAITEWKTIIENIWFDEKEQENWAFFYEYINKGKTEKKHVFYINEEFLTIISLDELKNELNEYIKYIKNEPNEYKKYMWNNALDTDISILAINKIKNALCANIIGIIMKLQEKFPGYVCFESLSNDNNNRDMEKEHSFLWNLINDKLYSKLNINVSVPPILKKFRSELKNSYYQYGQVIYVNEDSTSSACPVCNDKFIKWINKKWNLEEYEKNKLYGHLTESESSMHHLTDDEYNKKYDNNEKFREKHTNDKGKKKDNIYGSWNWCNYHMKDNPKWFDFIKSWDDLATYNIAKKALEYLEYLKSLNSDETK